MNIVDLNKLNKTDISAIDPLFIQDVSKSETKLLLSFDLSKYIVSSSNLIVSLKSGSFTGSFYGNLNGISTNASSSFLSKHSNNSTYLNYPNYSTASYSLFSISSSKSNNSVQIISASYSISSSNSTNAPIAISLGLGKATFLIVVTFFFQSYFESFQSYVVIGATYGL